MGTGEVPVPVTGRDPQQAAGSPGEGMWETGKRDASSS